MKNQVTLFLLAFPDISNSIDSLIAQLVNHMVTSVVGNTFYMLQLVFALPINGKRVIETLQVFEITSTYD